MDRAEVGFESRPPLGLVTLPGPPWGRRVALELDDLLASLEDDDTDEIRVLVLAGPSGAQDRGAPPVDDATDAGVDPPARIAASRRPVVAVVAGDCRGPELVVALAADIRIAGPLALFALPEVAAGTVPGWDAIGRLVRVVGPARATPMVLAGQEVRADRAAAMGLVHEMSEDPLARALELAGEMAERGPLALEYAKEAIWRGSRMPLTDGLRLEADFNHLLQSSSDRAEGLAAFFDKRPPRFRGR